MSDQEVNIEPTKEDLEISAVQQQLDNLSDGCKIKITRVSPTWCAGHLETIHIVDPSEPVDLDTLISRWGGQVLRITIMKSDGRYCGGGTIACKSYRPRVRGRDITEEDLLESPLTRPRFQAPQQPVAQQVNPLGQLGLDIPSLIKLAQGGKGDSGALISKVLEPVLYMQQQAIAQAAQQPQTNMVAQMEQMMSMMKFMSEMRGMFSGDGAPDGDGLTPMLGQLLSGIMSAKQQQQAAPAPHPQQHRKPRIVGPPAPHPQQIAGPPPQTAGHPGPNHQQNVNPPSLRELSDYMAKLSPRDAASVAVEAFGAMPEDQRNETIKHFAKDVFDEDLDDMSDPNDTDRYDQSAEQLPSQVSPSERRAVRADVGDDPFNR